MTDSTAPIVLCPGQGAQHVGMGKSWCEKHPAAAETFAHADRVLGMSLTKACFEGPEEHLNRTDIAQAAIYVTSVACYRALAPTGRFTHLAAVAGLSLGEFTALHLAGAYDFDTGLKLVRLRGQAMQQAAEASPSGMVALIGADEAQANELCDKARGPHSASASASGAGGGAGGVLVPANFNCPGQVVISGSADACQRSLAVAQEMGLRATPLKVAGAFHSPLMKPAADRLAAALDAVDWKLPAVPVMSNVTALPHDSRSISSIKARLVEQLTSPVRWAQSIQWLAANIPNPPGTASLVELAPGKVLSGFMRRIDKSLKIENLADPA